MIASVRSEVLGDTIF